MSGAAGYDVVVDVDEEVASQLSTHSPMSGAAGYDVVVDVDEGGSVPAFHAFPLRPLLNPTNS